MTLVRGVEALRWRSAGPAAGTAAVATLWGTSGVVVRHIDLSAVQIAGGRAAVGALALTVWLLSPAGRRHRRLQAGRWSASITSGVLLAAHWWTFTLALQRISIGTVLLGIYLAPLMITALARHTLGETVTGRQVAALGLAMAGAVLIFQPDQAGGWGGVALIGFSAAAYAGSILASKRVLLTAAPLALSAVQLGVVAVLLVPVSMAEPLVVHGGDLARIAVLGVVYSAAAQLIYLRCLRKLPAVTSGILLYLEPVSALISGWLLLSETPTAATVCGALLILLAGGAISYREATAHRTSGRANNR
ncbi:DMT family transporter [Micromonospora sp. R77]|uniref:DMT family transporter n=1 Tax=Micromonospora sp. R77 TaxID=2925836 RepID=UPI001F60268D|nr:DMT family transporter [Micromonospora sp. R77]MCI4066145.1 DMT family transporter [Micromonospora sp. R77]